MGQNASPEGRAELREPGTRLIGSVAYFPEKYGAEIVAVALDILHRRAGPARRVRQAPARHARKPSITSTPTIS